MKPKTNENTDKTREIAIKQVFATLGIMQEYFHGLYELSVSNLSVLVKEDINWLDLYEYLGSVEDSLKSIEKGISHSKEIISKHVLPKIPEQMQETTLKEGS